MCKLRKTQDLRPIIEMRHHHIYHHLAKEINDRCSGMIITECYTQEKHCVIVHCEAPDGSLHQHIEWTMTPSEPILALKEAVQRANKNSVDMFPDIIGRKISSCSKHPTDRIIFLQLTGACMIGQFFGGSNTALFTIDAEDRLTDYMKRAPVKIGEPYISSISAIPSLNDVPKDVAVSVALSKAYNCGSIYANEILDRYNEAFGAIDARTKLSSLTDTQYERLYLLHEGLMDESLQSDMAYILRLKTGEIIPSTIHVHKEQEVMWSGHSWSQAIRRYRGVIHKESAVQSLKKKLEQELKQRRETLEKHIHHLSDEATSLKRIEESQLIANLLLSMPHPALRVNDELIVLSHDGKNYTIPTQKGKTYAEHAEHYFRKAKRSKERDAEKSAKLPIYLQQLQDVMQLQNRFPEIQDRRILEQMLLQVKAQSREKASTKNTQQSPYRIFALSESFTLYVGRNAKNNDQLTGKFAKPNDLWLHARGVSGSHAVLRGPKDIPKHILEQAAAITAYFSQSRKAGFVPVAYALKKYIRKPKGAGPGAVLMEREEVILIEPTLPKGTIDV